MADHDYKTGRLHGKYKIEKADGSPIDPDAKYFVLRYDSDPHALVALRAYAFSVEKENPEFGADLWKEIEAIETERNKSKHLRGSLGKRTI